MVAVGMAVTVGVWVSVGVSVGVGVALGGDEVPVAGTVGGVLVDVGAIDVAVFWATDVRVAVGGTGVRVAVGGGPTTVDVGGTVSVAVGCTVSVGVGGGLVGVAVGSGVAVGGGAETSNAASSTMTGPPEIRTENRKYAAPPGATPAAATRVNPGPSAKDIPMGIGKEARLESKNKTVTSPEPTPEKYAEAL